MKETREYLVQPKLYAERKADYKKGEAINSKWKPISGKQAQKLTEDPKHPLGGGMCGNLHYEMLIDRKTLKATFAKKRLSMFEDRAAYKKQSEKYEDSLANVISSALALYRLICLFENPIVETQGAAGYKVPWSLAVRHVETGEVLQFGEWKGAFGIWTRFHKPSELPATYKRDLLEVLNLIFSDRSPHPYDGCTAGQVA